MKEEEIKKFLAQRKKQQNFRTLTPSDPRLINLSSNDYLGLADNKELEKEFFQNYHPKLSSSSSRLMDGNYPEVLELENELQNIYQKPGLVFNSGFSANTSIIKTFYRKNSLILTDRLNHASIYEGILQSGAKFLRYRHLDMNHLEELLKKNQKKYDDILVVSETIYSMDGDCCELEVLIQLKKKYSFDLLIDEAHSYGVYGYGLSVQKNVVNAIDFLVIPLGKGGASIGAYVICSQLCKEYLINKSKEFIYSTANPPVNNAWNLFLLKKMPDFSNERKKLYELTDYFLQTLNEYGIPTSSTTQIIRILLGENQFATHITERLKYQGFNVYCIKEPTVPKNTARLRVSLNPTLTKKNLSQFVEILAKNLEEHS